MAALRRPAAAWAAAGNRHRTGDPARRASARVRIRAAAPSPDGAGGTGWTADLQAAIFAWPGRSSRTLARLTARQQALLAATDEFVTDRTITDETWQQLAATWIGDS